MLIFSTSLPVRAVNTLTSTDDVTGIPDFVRDVVDDVTQDGDLLYFWSYPVQQPIKYGVIVFRFTDDSDFSPYEGSYPNSGISFPRQSVEVFCPVFSDSAFLGYLRTYSSTTNLQFIAAGTISSSFVSYKGNISQLAFSVSSAAYPSFNFNASPSPLLTGVYVSNTSTFNPFYVSRLSAESNAFLTVYPVFTWDQFVNGFSGSDIPPEGGNSDVYTQYLAYLATGVCVFALLDRFRKSFLHIGFSR